MSLKKSATRRLSLLAGSSLVAASLGVLSMGAPTAAYAYDECAPANAPTTLTDGTGGVSDPTLNGATADNFSCTAATYATGIAYSSAGALTVTKTNTGVTTITAGGVDLTGNGADAVTWVSSVGGITGGALLTDPGPVGPLIDVTSVSGAISVTTNAVTANRAGTTHGVRAVSTGGAGVTIVRTAGALNNNVLGGVAGIQAVTNGGNIAITSGTGATQGYARGILAQTSGAGSVTLTLAATSASTLEGVAAIDVTAGTGGIALTATGTSAGGTGTGVLATTTGAINMTLAGVTGATRAITATSSGALNMTLNGAVSTTGTGGAISATSGGALAITLGSGGSINGGSGAAIVGVAAAGATITNAGTVGASSGGGRIDLSGVTGGAVTFASSGSGRWLASGASVFTGAGDTLSMAGSGQSQLSSGASINLAGGDDTFTMGGLLLAAGGSIDFGAGADLMTMSGGLTVNGLTLTNLETFNNSGVIYMGGPGGGITDNAPGEVLAMTAAFTGSGASRIVMDVSFAAGGQSDCSTPTAADCVDFTGGSTAGTTLLTIINADGSSASGSSSRTTLIAGSSAADDFALDPNSAGYVVTAQGGALRKRLFDFHLLYDDDTHQHALVAVPHVEAFQEATVAASAQDIWRSTTGSWFDRQADLRATPGGVEPSRGLWVRGGVSVGERDVVIPLELLGTAFIHDVSYRQRTAHAAFGVDVLGAATRDGAWVLGASAGLVRSDTDYDAPVSELVYAGFTGGLYASLIAGPVFVDAALNANLIDINIDMPSLAFDDNVKLTQAIRSVGGQIEAGWRIAVGEAVFAEPLASVSYVKTDLDRIDVPGAAGTFDFEDGATSLRVGAGLRLGADAALMGHAASYSLTGRYSSELEGENVTGLVGNAPTLLVDDVSGGFSEVAASLNLYSDGGVVSGFINLGGKFAEDYRSVDGSVGVRVRW